MDNTTDRQKAAWQIIVDGLNAACVRHTGVHCIHNYDCADHDCHHGLANEQVQRLSDNGAVLEEDPTAPIPLNCVPLVESENAVPA